MTTDPKILDLNFIKNGNWPAYPFLPLKKYSEKNIPDTAILIDGEGPTLFLVNLFSLATGDQNLENCQKLKFDNFEAIVNDGWMVD